MIFSRIIKNIKSSVIFNYNRNKLFYNSNTVIGSFNTNSTTVNYIVRKAKAYYYLEYQSDS